MTKKSLFAPLLTTLRDLTAWLKAEGVSGTIIGGVAASILGRPRVTRDIDALVLLEEEHWAEFLKAGTRFGFAPRGSDSLAFAKKTRVLLVEHRPSGISVDIVLGRLPFEEEAVANAIRVRVDTLTLPLAHPEYLVVMKAVANRPRDLADIEAILDRHPRLDLKRARRWISEFASALDMPGILEEFETVLAKSRKKKGKKTSHRR